MEQINNIELADENIYPDESVLQKVLGASYPSYCDLHKLFGSYDMTHEWRYYRDGKAWLCKVQKKKRTIIWLSAWKGYIKATIYLPEKHTDGLYCLEIEEETRRRLKDTKHVGKSIPCMFEIKNSEVLKDLETVMKYKIATR